MLPSRSDQPQTFLDSCLLEGDCDLERRTRRGKRRALLLSILLQLLIVSALVLIPLLSRGENLTATVLVAPSVPYSRAGHPQGDIPRRPPASGRDVCHFCQPHSIPVGIVIHDPTPPADPGEPEGPTIPGTPIRDGVTGGDGDPSLETPGQPPPPDSLVVQPPPRRQVSEGVEAAMLTCRVQPRYPFLAVQLHREGRVELHAIISTDGTIQSLEVISGDPLFIKSATEAVDQWRYRPTLLNGQPIEIDTRITVLYTLTH